MRPGARHPGRADPAQTLEALQGNSFTGAVLDSGLAYALVGACEGGRHLADAERVSAGPLQASLPAISAGEPLIGILLGVIVFGDRIQISPGLLAIQAGGVAALVVGVVMVASDPALSQLREQASKPRRRPRYRYSRHPEVTARPLRRRRRGWRAARRRHIQRRVAGRPGARRRRARRPAGRRPAGRHGAGRRREQQDGAGRREQQDGAGRREQQDGPRRGERGDTGAAVAGDRGGAEMIADQRAQAAVGPMVARRAASWLPPAHTASGTSTANSHFIPDGEVDGRSPVRC